jgi:hypothetical protein
MRTHSDEWNTEPSDLPRPVEKVVAPSVTGPTRGAPVPSLDRDTLLSLQATIGNAGVERLLRSDVRVPGDGSTGPAVVVQRQEDDEEGEEEEEAAEKRYLEELIKEPAKRAEKLAKFKLPSAAKKYELATPETELFADMASGCEKASEYVKYVTDALEYYNSTGIKLPIDGALGDLQKVATGVSGRLERIKGAYEWAERGVRLLQAGNQWATETRGLRFDDPDSVRAWLDTMKRLQNAALPFAQWAKDKLVDLAIYKASPVAARAFLAFSYVWIMADLGRQGLEAGTRNVQAYIDRLNEKTTASEDSEMHRIRAVPPPPPAPSPWESHASARRRAISIDATKVITEEKRERQNARDREEIARRKFREVDFRGPYVRNRTWLIERVLGAVTAEFNRVQGSDDQQDRDQGEAGQSGPDRWWGYFLPGNDFRDPSGVGVLGRLDSLQDAQTEIDQFLPPLSGRPGRPPPPPCPFFMELFEREFSRYWASERATTGASSTEPAVAR